MKGIFAKYIPAAFIFSLLLVFINTLVSVYNLQVLITYERLINQTQQIIGKLNVTLASVNNLEIYQRNYIITDNSMYLQEYEKNIPRITSELKDLKALTSESTIQKNNVLNLEKKIQEKITILQKGLTRYREEGFSGVQEFILSGEGYRKTREIQVAKQIAENEERRLLGIRNDRAARGAYRTYLTLFIASLLNIGLIFITYYLTKRELEYRSGRERRKDEFVSMATHELKTPITSLQVFAEILQKRVKKLKDAQSEQHVERIISQVSRLKDLIGDLLDVSKIQVGKMQFDIEPFNLDLLIREIVENFQQTTEQHKIIVKGKAGKGTLKGDKDRIGQVLTNLLSNAIKYSPGANKIIITVKKNLRNITVGVQDFGIGIPDSHSERIFERFYRVSGDSEKEFPGLGMGLYISQEIVKRHKGKLWFESIEGRGSTFYFTLPVKK